MKINLRNISKAYGDLVLFDNLNLDIEEGKITCLYGYSGCGKTTLLNIIGLIEKYDGKIIFDGVEMKRKREINQILRNKIGFIFQEFGLIENETVLSNFKLVKKIRKKSREEIDNIMNYLSLNNMLDKKVYKLSGGEKQRVAIAKVMLKDVELILADEPTGSIDTENSLIVIDLLKKTRDAGKTIIISSHDELIKNASDILIDVSQLRVK